jgi:deoxyribodipyrimidine photo-lyase
MFERNTLAASRVPECRVVACNRKSADRAGRYVLYWMTASRRCGWNFGLDRAVDWARELGKPLVVLETLACGRWASLRHHRFAMDGMAETARRLADSAATYYPFVEPKPGLAGELAAALAGHACVVVADDYPIRESVEELDGAARKAGTLVEKIDSNGLLPMRLADKTFSTAHAFRRFLQKTLPEHLLDVPRQNPLARARLEKLDRLSKTIVRRWPPTPLSMLDGEDQPPAVDRSVAPADMRGGETAARTVLRQFLARRLPHYDQRRNHPEEEATSGLSPYLHFGQISMHEVFRKLAESAGWSPDRLAEKPSGSRQGWWGMSEPAEAFLDELVTWREVGFNMCVRRPDYDRYESLPDWSRKTLKDHANDERKYVYSLEEFASAGTHDPLWNAAQVQLLREGRMHNYLRMLWGKKILEWTAAPGDAVDVMIDLNNKYALDGSDPNSYSGIFWVLGRYDRPWGPERPIFGKVRYMSSDNTARKFPVAGYVEKYSPESL